MPIFSYTTKDMNGEYHKGEVETVDQFQAATLLRRKRLIIISIKEKNKNQENLFDKYFNRIPFSVVVVMTRQLATMVQAGLVLSEALDILQDQQENKKFKKVLIDILADIKGGLDFAAALQKHPDVFPAIYGQLVAAGQASGKLDIILLQLANNLEKEREFKGKIRGAMIYPIVVVTMMVGVMLIMVFFVMPKLLSLYGDSNIELPLPTKILMGFSNFMLGYWWLILVVIVVALVSFRRYSQTQDGRLRVDEFLLKAPAIGKITSLVILTSFTRTFGLLVSSGLSILDSIKIVSAITGNRVYQDGLILAYQGVERGLSFSSQVLRLPEFPRIIGQMIKTGEETGKLDEIMFKLADYFESESDNSLKNITTLIEPVVLVILGIGVGFLVVSIILPIYQLTTNIK
ncbi:MAG: type II secretion system F family protein [Candidatus Daviesbacteria bacterium]|nr:type II secretion system F family protein [Candidatus Daviesbacteria bacterium]